MYESLNEFQTAAKSKDLDLILLNRLSTEEAIFSSDIYTVTQIFANLIDNAIKFSLNGDSVSINAFDTEHGVTVQVNDTGVGMNTESIKDIFVLKSDKSTLGTQGEKGTGIGLHIVNELVKLNKGAIKVMSIIKDGTQFEIVLPNQAV